MKWVILKSNFWTHLSHVKLTVWYLYGQNKNSIIEIKFDETCSTGKYRDYVLYILSELFSFSSYGTSVCLSSLLMYTQTIITFRNILVLSYFGTGCTKHF